MAINQRIPAFTRLTLPEARTPVEQPAAVSPDPLVRLAALHADARETAELANLLGRSIYLVALLPILGMVAVSLADTSLAQKASWSVMVLAGAGTLFLAYRRAMRAPFELIVLRTFAQDLNAILFYTGFAWGAGGFLALSASVLPPLAVLFSAGAATAVASVLRDRQSALFFVAPLGLVTSLAALIRPLPFASVTAAMVPFACLLVMAATFLSTHLSARFRHPVTYADLKVA